MEPNRLNYAQKSNFIAGCSELFRYEFYIQEFNLPGLSINPVETYNNGIKHLVMGDGITHTELSLSIMIDEDFLVYQALKKWMEDSVNQVSGSFAERSFTFYCDVHNNKGNYLFTVMFYGCKITSMSDVQMIANDDSASNVISVSVEYDWFEIRKSGLPDQWKKDFNIVEIPEEEPETQEEEITTDDILQSFDDDSELNEILSGDDVPAEECNGCGACRGCVQCNCECDCDCERECDCDCDCECECDSTGN